jgi:Zn-dependent peptidase ImmA (M78 family)
MRNGLTSAERLLISLGVTEPLEIDVEAIALTMGAKVKFRRLDGCAARITGTMERAVITVDESSGWRRRRFSVGHELGHWRHHRGQAFECKVSNIESPKEFDPLDPERQADQFAADLLMPSYLFRPAANSFKKMTLDGAEKLSNMFNVSLTAAAIRLLELGPAPAMLVCHGTQGRRWFKRHRDLPETLFPPKKLDRETFAQDVMDGKMDRSGARKIGAEAWTDRLGASNFEVTEQTFRIGEDSILTMVWWHDEAQIEAELQQGGRLKRGNH